MLKAQAWNLQAMEILQARHDRDEPLGLELRDWFSVSEGQAFFYVTNSAMNSNIAEEDLWKLVKSEPLFISTGDGAIMCSLCGSLELYDYFVDNFDENWLESDPQNPNFDSEAGPEDVAGWLCIVMHGLNIPLQDSQILGRETKDKNPELANKRANVSKQADVFLL